MGSQDILDHCFFLYESESYSALLEYLTTFQNELQLKTDYWLLLGIVRKHMNCSPDSVIDAYSKALELDNTRSDLYFNLANSYRDIDIQVSFHYYLRCLELDPLEPSYWHNFSSLVTNNPDLNIPFSYLSVCFKNCIILDPHNPDYYSDYAMLLSSNSQHTSAINTLSFLIEQYPSFFPAYNNLANLFYDLLELPLALETIERGLVIYKDNKTLLFLKSLCLLRVGEFKKGWSLYCFRPFSPFLNQFKFSPEILSSFRLDVLSTLPEHVTLNIWAEQGLGDTIQFARYLKLLDSSSIKYVFYCQPELVKLISEWFQLSCPILPYPSSIKEISEHTLDVPLLSLPSVFGTTSSTIPSSLTNKPNNLSIPDHLKLSNPIAGLSVGLVWASDPSNKRMYTTKSIDLDLIIPRLISLAELDLISLHNLQIGPDSVDFNNFLSHQNVYDTSALISDFSDTAHIISQLDLVISVDTAVAHLSSSLNCPTWVMLPYSSDFRWLLDTNHSPWYPSSLRLFRQESPGDWSSVIDSIHNCLDEVFMLSVKDLYSSKCI